MQPHLSSRLYSYVFNLRKYQNPHHCFEEQSLRNVSRQELADDCHEPIGLGLSNTETKTPLGINKALGTLNKLLSPLAIEFADATRVRKQKGGKSLKPQANESQAISAEIRLVSQISTVLDTSEPVNGWPSQSKIYFSEDTEDQAQRRRRQAMQVAVDFQGIMKQSTVPYPHFKAVHTPVYKTKSVLNSGTIAAIECPKPQRSRHLHVRMGTRQLKTRDIKTKKSLIIATRSNHPPLKQHTDTPAHGFYHSETTIGGKSTGYAWGYQGSFPRTAGAAGYIRDSMKKGVANLEMSTTQPGGLGQVSAKVRVE